MSEFNSTKTLFGTEYLGAMAELIASTALEERFKAKEAYLHWPYVGSGYFKAPRRVLYVGRASYKGGSPAITTDEVKNAPATLKYLTERIADREPFMGGPGGCEAYFTTDKNGKAVIKNRYFWKLLRSACEALGMTECSSADPFRAIAWSNLFKIAPLGAGNPPKWMQKLELTDGKAGKLLQIEINQLDPDVVIFVTGHTWMHPFWWRDSTNRLNIEWEPDATNWCELPIHRIGHQQRASGHPRLFVATARPEQRSRSVALARKVPPALAKVLQHWAAEHPSR